MARKSQGGKLTSSSAASSQHNLFIIDDESLLDPILRDKVFCPVIDGDVKGHGMVPRDYAKYPAEMFDPVTDLPLLDVAEYDDRIATQEKDKSSIEHYCEEWESLDQGGQGFCWSYSTTGCQMAVRSLMHLPMVRLSAHAVACKIKGFVDEGGWCGLSGKFQQEKGVPSIEFWPEKSMSRQYDKPEVWANAAMHIASEVWQDITRNIYDMNFTLRQLDTCLLTNIPCATDFNWWGHSVMMGRLVKVEGNSFGRKIRNSWGQSWGEKGWAILRGSKANPDSAIALRVTGVSPN